MADFRLIGGAVFLLALVFGLAVTVRCDDDNDEYLDPDHVCDFILIGAGTTTLTLAGKLAEVPHWKVCVLERGPMEESMEGWYTNGYKFTTPHDPFWLTQPALATMNRSSSGYLSNKNKDGRLIYIPRFRGRGGTSRVYGAIARRASPEVLGLWPEGWKHEDITPYYKRTEDHYCFYDSENVTGISPEECEKWHGKGGPMQLNTQLEEAFQNFPRKMKYLCEDESMPWHGFAHDYNGPKEDRISCSVFQQFKLRTDKYYNPTVEARINRAASTARGSSYTGYYQHNNNKPILYHSSPVTKILFEGNKAVGVRYLYVPTGRTHVLRARKEVIVGAGSFDTPHILQVSGVGPKDLLDTIGVKVVADNAHVGQHLWDHISVPYVLKLSAESDDLCCKTEGSDVPKITVDGTEYKTSDLSSINGPFSWILHLRSNLTDRVPADMSDIQIYVMGNSKLFDETGALCTADQPEYNHDEDEYEDLGDDNEGTIRVIDQWPEYRGSINATTPNVFDKPELEYGWTYSVDGEKTPEFKKVSTLVRDQVRMLRNMFFGSDVHPDLKKLVVDEVAPGRHVQTDEDLDTWMRGMLVSALHPVGTCKMPECADEFLQVRGTANLRVCDASAFATQIDGNPSATLFAMGEKLSDMLKFQYLKYVNVAVRKDLNTPLGEDTVTDSTFDSATQLILSTTKCIKASVEVEHLSIGKDTSALIVKWSLLCGEDSNEREIADNVAMTTLGLAPMDGCSLREYPLFNRPEGTLPAREPTQKHAVSSYVFIVYCMYFPEATPEQLWSDVGNWKGDIVPGSKNCFKLNCDPEMCSVLKYFNDENRELIYTEPDLQNPAIDYISTKKVISRFDGKSASLMRTGSMISNPGADWYADIAGDLLENVYSSYGRRASHKYPPLSAQGGWWTESTDGLLYYEMKGVYSGEKIAAFDLDGTIISTKSGETYPVDENDWVFKSPTVKAKIQDNHKQGIKNVIMSNQNGIGLGYQDKGQWMAKVEQITAELDVPMYVIAATGSNQYRKPDTGMWDFFACTLNQFKIIKKATSVYVGDAAGRPHDHSGDDRLFAKNVGVKFFTPEMYFDGKRDGFETVTPEMYSAGKRDEFETADYVCTKKK